MWVIALAWVPCCGIHRFFEPKCKAVSVSLDLYSEWWVCISAPQLVLGRPKESDSYRRCARVRTNCHKALRKGLKSLDGISQHKASTKLLQTTLPPQPTNNQRLSAPENPRSTLIRDLVEPRLTVSSMPRLRLGYVSSLRSRRELQPRHPKPKPEDLKNTIPCDTILDCTTLCYLVLSYTMLYPSPVAAIGQ